MQKLHLVGYTADLEGLIFSARKGSKSGTYVVAIDDALLAALDEARRLGHDEPIGDAEVRIPPVRVRGRLTVREIQARLRSGRSVAQVAEEAGADESWVARFAPPVLAEQAAVVERATPLTFATTRKGPSSQPLGDAVRWNLADRGVVLTDQDYAGGWSAYQLSPGRWVVRFAYTSRGRSQVAEWEVDLDAGELSARNRLASDLGHVDAGARRKRHDELVPPGLPPAVPEPARSRGGDRTTGRRSTRPAVEGDAPTAATRSRTTRAGTAARKPAAKATAASRVQGSPAKAAAATKAAGTKKAAAGKRAAAKGVGGKQPAKAATKAAGTPKGSAAKKSAGKRATPAKSAPKRPAVEKGAAKRATPAKVAGKRATPAKPAQTAPPRQAAAGNAAGSGAAGRAPGAQAATTAKPSAGRDSGASTGAAAIRRPGAAGGGSTPTAPRSSGSTWPGPRAGGPGAATGGGAPSAAAARPAAGGPVRPQPPARPTPSSNGPAAARPPAAPGGGGPTRGADGAAPARPPVPRATAEPARLSGGPAATAAVRPGEAPAGGGQIRRLPAPSATAEARGAARRGEGSNPSTDAAPPTGAQADGRKPILVIRAERAGDRRRPSP